MPIDGQTIDEKVALGFARAAAVAGFKHDLYRPTDPLNPLRLLDRIATINAVFDARPSLKFTTPALPSNPIRYAIVDTSEVQAGDYLVGVKETVFVADLPRFYGPTCVHCNASVSLRRLTVAAGFGAIADRSDAVTGETLIFANWPCSMLFAGRGGGDAVATPGDLPNPEYVVLLPVIPGVSIPQPSDVLLDEKGRRLSVAFAEENVLGWRLVARLLTAG
jgi:hypothetical protein